MSRTTVIVLLVGAFLAGMAGWLVYRSSGSGAPVAEIPGSLPVEESMPVDVPEEETGGWSVTLYFPGQDGSLHGEDRRLLSAAGEVPEAVHDQVALLVRALLAGPQSAALRAPLPPGTALLGVEVQVEERIAWIDLGPGQRVDESEEPEAAETSDEGVTPPAREPPGRTLQGGSKQELLIVYSVVDSVTHNVEGVDRVGLLWNGSQGSTFAGHVDTTRPLRADDRYLARR